MTLFIHKPIIIAVAGSINKPFIKNEISRVLAEQGIKARSNQKNFNTEIGLPLAILNLYSGYNSYKNWLPIIIKAPGIIFKKNFPAYLVLELGTSDPGDIKYLLSIIKPKISIITDITQRYLEGFSDIDSLISEYKYLAKKNPKNGLLILNYDNSNIRNLKKEANCPVKFYGHKAEADCHVLNITKNNNGQFVAVSNEGNKINVQINKFGEHHVRALLVGLIVKDYVAKQN